MSFTANIMRVGLLSLIVASVAFSDEREFYDEYLEHIREEQEYYIRTDIERVTRSPSNPTVSDVTIDVQDHRFFEQSVDVGAGSEMGFSKNSTYLTLPLRYSPHWAKGFGLQAFVPIIFKEERFDEKYSGIGDITVRLNWYGILAEQLYGGVGFGVTLPTGDEDEFLGSGVISFLTALSISHTMERGMISQGVQFQWYGESDYDDMGIKASVRRPTVLSTNTGYMHTIYAGFSGGIFAKTILLGTGNVEIGKSSTDLVSDRTFLFDLAPQISYAPPLPILSSIYARAQFPIADNGDGLDRDVAFGFGFSLGF